jgi:hypothetical protein
MSAAMTPQHLSRALVAALGAAALALPATASAADVAFFNNSTYVDTGAAPGGEATNLAASLTAKGHAVAKFTGITAADFTAALAGKDALVFPEQEPPASPTLSDTLDADAKTAMRSFVENGGNFVTFAQHKGIMDAVFGFAMGAGNTNMGGASVKQPVAADTPYKDGPDMLPANSAVYGIDASKLPAGAKVIYQRTQSTTTYAVVFLIPYGKGTITYFGWDWYNSNPPSTGGADGGWQELLSLATTASAAMPALSIADVTHTEGTGDATTAKVTVSLPAAVSGDVTASWATADGTAVAGEDYTASSGTVTIPAGATSATVEVPVTADAVDEADETFSVKLSSPAGAMLDRDTATVTIADDDEPAMAAEPLQGPVAETPGPPVAKQCVSRRVVKITLPARSTKGLRATVAGRKLKIRDGMVVADLRGLKPGAYKVAVKDRAGRTILRRTLRTCMA